jgi:hypothetical protein
MHIYIYINIHRKIKVRDKKENIYAHAVMHMHNASSLFCESNKVRPCRRRGNRVDMAVTVAEASKAGGGDGGGHRPINSDCRHCIAWPLPCTCVSVDAYSPDILL